MVLEWLRRSDPRIDEQLRTYLFSEGAITEIEDASQGEGDGDGSPDDGSLGIGSLRAGGSR